VNERCSEDLIESVDIRAVIQEELNHFRATQAYCGSVERCLAFGGE
jgi:hypothetical protein